MTSLNETLQGVARELGGIEEHLKAQDEKFDDRDRKLAEIATAVSGKNGVMSRVAVLETERDSQGKGLDRRLTVTAICVTAIASVAGIALHFI